MRVAIAREFDQFHLYLFCSFLIFFAVIPCCSLLAETPEILKAEPSQGFIDVRTPVALLGTGFGAAAKVGFLDGGPFVAARLETGGFARSIAISGEQACIAIDQEDGSSLLIIRISEPLNAEIVSNFRPHGPTAAIAYAQDTIFATGLSSDETVPEGFLEIIDASDPAHPFSAALLHFSGYPSAIQVRDGHAIMTGRMINPSENQGFVRVFDVSNPWIPAIIGIVETPGPAMDLAILDDDAFVADGLFGLHVIDLHQLPDPVLINTLAISGGAQSIALSGNHALVIGSGGFSTIDVAEAAKPTQTGSADIQGFAIDASTEYAYVIRQNGLHALDISGTGAPYVSSFTYLREPPSDLSLSGENLFIANGNDGLTVINVHDSAGPDPLAGSMDLLGHGILKRGNMIYMTDPLSNFSVIDISDPRNPVLAGGYPAEPWIAGPSGLAGMAEANGFVYLARWWDPGCNNDQCHPAGASLKVLDVRVPSDPQLVNYRSFENRHILGLALWEKNLYLLRAGLPMLLYSYDVSDPASPVFVSSQSIYSGGITTFGLAASRGFLYIPVYESSSSRCRLDVIDVRDSFQLIHSGSVNTPGCAYPARGLQSVAVSGERAFVAGTDPLFTGGWLGIVDIADQDHPLMNGSYSTKWFTSSLDLQEERAGIATEAGFEMIDVSDPQAPALIARHETSEWTSSAALSDGYVYLAGENLRILRLNPDLQDISIHPEPGSTNTSSSVSTIELTVPPSFNPGPYHILVTNREGEAGIILNGFRACVRRELAGILEPHAETAPKPGEKEKIRPLEITWKLKVEGDPAFFKPRRHEAHLILPDLPASLEKQFVPATNGGDEEIILKLHPHGSSGIVQIVGKDFAEMNALWEKINGEGKIDLPIEDDHRYGELRLSIFKKQLLSIETGCNLQSHSAGKSSQGAAQQNIEQYRFVFANRRLTAAQARGLDADIRFEISAHDRLSCETRVVISFAETLRDICARIGQSPLEILPICEELKSQ